MKPLKKKKMIHRLLAVLMVASVIPLLAKLQAFVVSIVSARALGAETFGVVVAAQTIASLFGVIGGAWGANVAVIAVAPNAKSAENFESLLPIWRIFGIAILSTACLVAVLPFVRPIVGGPASNLGFTLAIATYLLCQVASLSICTAASTTDQATKYAMIALTAAISAVPISWIAVHKFSIVGAIAASTYWHAAIFVSLLFFRLRSAMPEVQLRDRGRLDLMASWRALRPMLVASPAALVAAQLFATLLIGAQPGGIKEVALFYAAFQWKTVVVFLPTVLAPFVLARLVIDENERTCIEKNEKTRIPMKAIALSLVGVVLLSVPVFLLRETLMTAYGKSFLAGTSTLVLLLIGALFSSVVMPLEKAFIARRSEAAWAVITCAGCTSYALVTWFLRSAGGEAIAYGMIACLAAQAVIGICWFTQFNAPHWK